MQDKRLSKKQGPIFGLLSTVKVSPFQGCKIKRALPTLGTPAIDQRLRHALLCVGARPADQDRPCAGGQPDHSAGIFYLFSVRYVHGTSLTLYGVIGTPLVLASVVAITLAQFAVTYAPLLQRAFGTYPISLQDGWLVVAAGVVFLLVSESEKRVRRALGIAES